MTTVLLEDLDPRTSDWLRHASRHDGLVTVTDQGRTILTIKPARAQPAPRPRVLLPEFEAIMEGLGRGGTDSTEIISEERDRVIE